MEELKGQPDTKDTKEVNTDCYGDAFFNVERLHVFPREGELFEITNEVRLGRTLALLAESFPSLECPPDKRKQLLAKRRSYLSGRVTLPGGANPMRNQIIDIEAAYSQATQLLKSYNHPAIQLAEQLDREQNQSHDHDTEMRQLTEDLVTIVAWDQLKIIFETQVDQTRKDIIAPSIGLQAVDAVTEPSSPAA